MRTLLINWEQRKLSEVSDVVRGASPRPIQDPKWFDNNSNIGWLRISDVTEQDGRIRYLNQKISKLGQEKTRVLQSPHLLLSIAATVGKPVINYVPTGVHDGFLIFLNPIFNIEFMFQWFEMIRPNWKKFGQPGSQVNLNSEIVKNKQIFIPTLKEQTVISDFFQKLDQVLTLQQRRLKLLKKLKQSYLQQIFPVKDKAVPQLRFSEYAENWKRRTLENMAPLRGGFAFKSGSFKSDGVPIVRISNILSSGIVGNEFAYYDIQEKDENYLLPDKSVVLAMSGATTGKVAILNNPSNNKYYQNQRVGYFTKTKYIDYGFISVLVRSKLFSDQLISVLVAGAQPNVSSKDIDGFEFLIPDDLGEQKRIGTFFKYLDDTITLQKSKIEELEILKQAYLQKLFP